MLTERQHEILACVQKSPCQIQKWMHTNTIAALLKRKCVRLKPQRRRLLIEITPLGALLHTMTEDDYYDTLRSVSQTRKGYRNGK